MAETSLTTLEDLNTLGVENLTAMIGQAGMGKPANVGIPRLAIEQMADNDDGDKLPKGEYRLRIEDKDYYIKNPTVRFYVRYFSYDSFNSESPKDSPRTVLKPSLKDEFPDSKGGNKCGKLTTQEIEALPESSKLKVAQKSIKCTQVVYGYIDGKCEGTTLNGETEDLDGTPFVYSVRGSAFQPVWNFIGKLGQKTIMFSLQLRLSTKRNKMGSVTYFTPEIEEFDKVSIVDDDVKRISFIMDDISSYNDRIISMHKEHLKDKLTGEELAVSDSLEVA